MSDERNPIVESQERTGFLGRWSARKSDDAQQNVVDTAVKPDVMPDDGVVATQMPGDDLSGMAQVQDATASTSEAAISDTGASAGASTDVPLLCDDDMPPIQSLSSDSDISDFFNKGVSAALRKAALRHVFHQPKYNVRDGLNDYDGDYTVFEPLGDTITSDMKWHTARKERARLEAEEREREEALAREEELARAEAEADESQTDEVEEEASDESATDATASDENVMAESDQEDVGADDENLDAQGSELPAAEQLSDSEVDSISAKTQDMSK